MPKIQLTAEQQKRLQLEAELADFHNGEERVNNFGINNSQNGHIFPVMSEGSDRLGIYARFGCY